MVSRGTVLRNYFEFEAVVKEEIPFKRFLICCYGSPPDWLSGTTCAILKEGITWNIHVELYEIWNSGIGDVVLRYYLSGALEGFFV